jgi:hypothetical protein
MQLNPPKGIKVKMREPKLGSGVDWQGASKQKVVKQVGIKQGLGVYSNVHSP